MERIAQVIVTGGGPRAEVIPHIINADVWTIPTGLPLRHVNRVFEVHTKIPALNMQKIKDSDADIVYMHHPFAELKNSQPFPLNLLVDRFGENFNNSISYMLGLVIIEHEEGVRMAVRTGTILYIRRMHTSTQSEEYRWQTPQIREYIGIAKGVGIDVRISEHSILKDKKSLYQFKDYEYGSY